MARFPRVSVPDVPHHITQRGNARRQVFFTDYEREAYLTLLREYSRAHRMAILGYCLMPNHVHIVAIPATAESMPLALKYTNGRYGAFLNVRQGATGHVWQGRYYSCPLDERHLWTALRYVERNPVRAGLAAEPQHYRWSSARVHLGCDDPYGLVDADFLLARWSVEEWREFTTVDQEAHAAAEAAIRASTHTGRPLGDEGFVAELERRLGRALTPGRPGRPPLPVVEPAQLSML